MKRYHMLATTVPLSPTIILGVTKGEHGLADLVLLEELVVLTCQYAAYSATTYLNSVVELDLLLNEAGKQVLVLAQDLQSRGEVGGHGTLAELEAQARSQLPGQNDSITRLTSCHTGSWRWWRTRASGHHSWKRRRRGGQGRWRW